MSVIRGGRGGSRGYGVNNDLKFPPANSGLRLPHCNFQISHPSPSPPSTSKASKSKPSKSSPKVLESDTHVPLETTQAHLMASAINRSVRMGYDTPLSRRVHDVDDGAEDGRAVVTELTAEAEGDIEERGAVGARDWLRETMDWE
ncbi:hypothetical protein V492_02624 [Pseudogymnoascus sp. VKM F-4246]|nr:hypothetical protein V492_02624 [Pseudogymnoascus sp. VKM F-4246]